MSFELSTITMFARIKGYHAYRVKIDNGAVLSVQTEPHNKYDKMAPGVYEDSSREH